jgi:uncharacterized protein (TIGR02588 family)
MRTVRSIRRSRVGAMESLTVVILAVAAVVIAAIVWAFLSGTIQVQQTAADFAITSVEVRQMSTGQCIITLNIRNTGSYRFDYMAIQIRGPGNTQWNTEELWINLLPGKSMTRTYSTPCQPSWMAGATLLVQVKLRVLDVEVSKSINTVIQYGA